jgi:hypothetical protein
MSAILNALRVQSGIGEGFRPKTPSMRIFLHGYQKIILKIRLLQTRGAVRFQYEKSRHKDVRSYPGFVNLSFHSGRTRRAKYIAKPSLRPLKMALPELSPERCVSLSLTRECTAHLFHRSFVLSGLVARQNRKTLA